MDKQTVIPTLQVTDVQKLTMTPPMSSLDLLYLLVCLTVGVMVGVVESLLVLMVAICWRIKRKLPASTIIQEVGELQPFTL